MYYHPFEGIVVLLVICRLLAFGRGCVVLDPVSDLLASRLLVCVLVIASKQKDLHIWCLPQSGYLMSSLAESCVALAIVCPREGDIECIDGPQGAVRRLPVQIPQWQTFAHKRLDMGKEVGWICAFYNHLRIRR